MENTIKCIVLFDDASSFLFFFYYVHLEQSTARKKKIFWQILNGKLDKMCYVNFIFKCKSISCYINENKFIKPYICPFVYFFFLLQLVGNINMYREIHHTHGEYEWHGHWTRMIGKGKEEREEEEAWKNICCFCKQTTRKCWSFLFSVFFLLFTSVCGWNCTIWFWVEYT